MNLIPPHFNPGTSGLLQGHAFSVKHDIAPETAGKSVVMTADSVFILQESDFFLRGMVLGEIVKDPLLSTGHRGTGNKQCVNFIFCNEAGRLRHLCPLSGIFSARQCQIDQAGGNLVDGVDLESADRLPGFVSSVKLSKLL